MTLTDYLGGYYGSEVYFPKTDSYWWWNGSAWVLGRLPANLRGGMDECLRRKRENEDNPKTEI